MTIYSYFKRIKIGVTDVAFELQRQKVVLDWSRCRYGDPMYQDYHKKLTNDWRLGKHQYSTA